MIHPILLYGDPVLEQTSGDIPKNFPELLELVDDMYETMHKANGVGLSAIQIGIPYRIFVIEAHLDDFNFRDIFINPYIKREWGDKVKHAEGCLSVPQLTALVERQESIELEYYDLKWEKHVKTFSGFEARIIQHEYDHLQGKLYIDRLDKMWRAALETPLQLIKDREIEIPYLWKR